MPAEASGAEAALEQPGAGPARPHPGDAAPSRPRLGFVGTGWIGRNRLEALVAARAAEVVLVADRDPAAVHAAAEAAPGTDTASDLSDLLERADELDGVVIATPSGQHARQSLAAIEAGLAVFCQKPLGRSASEAARVVHAAAEADLLLGVDMCYRHTRAARAVHDLVTSGALGEVYAAELVFHNAYGPDKDWFYDLERSGGGCVMDLGIHLIDLLLWALGFPELADIESRLFHEGQRLRGRERVEDFATALVDTTTGVSARLDCSWNLHAGADAEIAAVFRGTEGAAALRNVGGSFYDFEAVHMNGTREETLVSPPDDWGGRAITAWAEQLGRSPRFDPAAREIVAVAKTLDRIYEACAF